MTESTQYLAKSDPVMARLIERIPAKQLDPTEVERPNDHYGALLRSITGQQLSVRAAAKIYQRVLDFFDGEIPTPEQILAADPIALKEAGGLSHAKTGYLRSLAEHVVSGELELMKLNDLPDDEVIAELVAVKGLGVWTAHMFLMFHLGREDVLPTGDLGIRRAVMIEYGLDELPGHDELVELAERWRPHRTLACRYLWASVDAVPE
jgi:DNA-3-methyladenine glycosylase II